MQIISEQRITIGIAPACDALGVARATFYRQGKPTPLVDQPRHAPRALSEQERAEVLTVLHEERFMDLAPAEVYATLLDENRYLCSISTMYRILQDNQEMNYPRSKLRGIRNINERSKLRGI
jgi:putative transposase